MLESQRACRTCRPGAGLSRALLVSVVGIVIAVAAGGSGPPPHPLGAAEAARPVGFADIVDRVKPAVFGVRARIEGDALAGGTVQPGSPLDNFFNRPNKSPGDGRTPREGRVEMAQGSGFFISPDGHAVTNNHVIEHSKVIEITTDDGKNYPARVIAVDAKTDLALIKVDGQGDFPSVPFADRPPRVGDWVIAVGNPFGLGGTVTAGIVSARSRDIGTGAYDDFLQIDAPVNQGNSGGPTFNVDGQVIGVNAAIFSPSGGFVGIAFAIPAEVARGVVTQLREKGSIARGWLGVQIQPLTRELADSLGLKGAQGVLVSEPLADGPAAKAGIASGDVIVSIESEPLKDGRELSRRVADLAPGTAIKLGVLRAGSERAVTVRLGELPSAAPRVAAEPPAASNTKTELGLMLAPAGEIPGAGRQGVVVIDAERGNGVAGIDTGDVILEVAGKAVNSPTDFSKAVAAARRSGKNKVLMRVRSGETKRFVAMPLG